MAELENTAIEVNDESKSEVGGQPKKALKRKRQSLTSTPPLQVETLSMEMEGLFGYYKEMMREKVGGLDLGVEWNNNNNNNKMNELVGVLMEESELPLSKLVEEIQGKLLKERNVSVTVGVVKSAVLLVGHRMMYGMPNVDADVLEDQTHSSLWCWETRDIKLLPKSVRGSLKIRRLCRKKIHERITAVSAMIAALQKPESDQDYKFNIRKASEKLGKVLKEADIRLLVDSMLQKNGAEMADKEVKREEKLLIKQLEKSKREAEREKKRMDIELQKEKRQIEKEQRRLHEEVERDERRREKEESEMRRQLRKQQEEAEKEQRRREREEAELKMRISVQKQASMMERFLKRNKTNSPCQNDQTPNNTITSDSSSKEYEKMSEAVTSSMDCALLSNDDMRIGDIRRSHLSSWRHLGHSIKLNRKQHWSIRKKPKIELFKELKLTATRDLVRDDELGIEKLVSGWGEQASDDRSCHTIIENSSPGFKKHYRKKQLLQFDKSHRPAFYGIWPKRSHVVRPRHPFRKEPDLDYDVDSDEEWEEEDPGESLSDCDIDDEEEKLEEGSSKADDEEESEDGFFVPDGYLSDNEGVQVDRMEIDTSVEETGSLPSCKQNLEIEEFCALLQQQKYLHNLTETALRKNQPLIVLNLMHEKVPSLGAEDLTGNSKLERMCLQALSIRTFPGGPLIEALVDNIQAEDQDVCPSNDKASTTPTSITTSIQDTDMPAVVSVICSCSQSINKMVDSLQQKFPSVSKTQLRNKVREISDFVDNHWQVKKEILDKVGMSSLPEKRGGRTQNISTFFSKRCLPPTGKSVDPNETSPQMTLKSGSVAEEQQVCTTLSHP